MLPGGGNGAPLVLDSNRPLGPRRIGRIGKARKDQLR
jgi:hypothetical protein